MASELDVIRAGLLGIAELAIARGKVVMGRPPIRLASLWQSQGKVTEARDLLAPIYDWFMEGFVTADIDGVKSLLDELS